MAYEVMDDNPGINIYDIVDLCDTLEHCSSGPITQFLNLDAVKEELGISTDIEWSGSNNDIFIYLYWETALDPRPWVYLIKF